ncbi:MoaD/ThiS family protein [Coraliomargarita parva]|uniref:MoaD/ThiS family protein n=1 Tax=Coraliomargarita parva TaxID=3014050 RepID=UPI0022B51CB5|nr:MoaD/ThiS family protein [Coraliomargarita parva]
MEVKILYFAQLADLADKSEETRQLGSSSPAALYADLQNEYGFPHRFKELQVAINHQLSAHATELKAGDSIAFLPPMTGG